MSKKARIAKKLRRKMQAELNAAWVKFHMEECFYDLFKGLCGMVCEKDGNIRMATVEEVDNAMTRGQVDQVPFEELTKQFKPRKLTYNVLSKIYEQRR